MVECKEGQKSWNALTIIGKLSVSKEYGGMNFRNLYAFNFAKHAWNIITNSHSLVTQVLKTKYFSHSDFLGARIGNNPSFIWRCICTSPVLLK